MIWLSILQVLAMLLSLAGLVYMAYYGLVMLAAFRQTRQYQRHKPQTRFLAVIAARNEEAVIGNLIASLQQQDYPSELFDILVIPNNCTDQTRDRALAAGAQVMDISAPVRSKGDVLREVFAQLLPRRQYDAYCIFDADNLVDPGFLQAMNDAVGDGVQIAQGNRDSKNPHDTIISATHSIYFWLINRFFNRSRSNLNLSATINGTGFMVTAPWLEKLGGWQTVTLREDLEFTQLTILAGGKVAWVPQAVTYDEHPLTMIDSWKQRTRWAVGSIQCMQRNLAGLIKATRGRDFWLSLDQIIYLLYLPMQLVSVVSLLVGLGLSLLYFELQLLPATYLFWRLFIGLNLSLFSSMTGAFIVTLMEKKLNVKILKGIGTFWILTSTWVLINIISIFKRDTRWEQINHTRVLSLKDIA